MNVDCQNQTRFWLKKFSGAASEKILEEMDEIIKEKPDSIIIHAGTII